MSYQIVKSVKSLLVTKDLTMENEEWRLFRGWNRTFPQTFCGRNCQSLGWTFHGHVQWTFQVKITIKSTTVHLQTIRKFSGVSIEFVRRDFCLLCREEGKGIKLSGLSCWWFNLIFVTLTLTLLSPLTLLTPLTLHTPPTPHTFWVSSARLSIWAGKIHQIFFQIYKLSSASSNRVFRFWFIY